MWCSGFCRSLSRDRRRERSLSRDRNHKPSRSLSASRRYWCSFSPFKLFSLVLFERTCFWTAATLRHTQEGCLFYYCTANNVSACIWWVIFYSSLLTAAPGLPREDKASVGCYGLEYEPMHNCCCFIRRTSIWMSLIMHYCFLPSRLKSSSNQWV